MKTQAGKDGESSPRRKRVKRGRGKGRGGEGRVGGVEVAPSSSVWTDSERTPCWILKRKHADPEAAPDWGAATLVWTALATILQQGPLLPKTQHQSLNTGAAAYWQFYKMSHFVESIGGRGVFG